MAKLKGGSYVAGAMTIEGVMTALSYTTTAGAIQVFADPAITAHGTYIPKFESSGNYELVKSIISDNGTTVTVAGELTVTERLRAASIYLEEDANSAFGLRLLNNSALTADHTLTFITANTDRSIDLSGGNLTISGAAKTIAGTGTTFTQNVTALTISGTTAATIAFSTASTTLTVANTASVSGTNTGDNAGVTSVNGTASSIASSNTGGGSTTISLVTAYGDSVNPYASKTAKYFLAAPAGSAGVPSFRAIVASDIPTLNQNTTGTAYGKAESALSVSYAATAGSAPANGGTATSATNLQSVSHPGTYWLSNTWDGTYWQLTSNHGAPVAVGKAANADNGVYDTGSNGNGYWIRFNNGVMMQWGKTISITAYAVHTQNYPLPFTAIPALAVNPAYDSASDGTLQYRMMAYANQASYYKIMGSGLYTQYIAIGRWV